MVQIIVLYFELLIQLWAKPDQTLRHIWTSVRIWSILSILKHIWSKRVFEVSLTAPLMEVVPVTESLLKTIYPIL